MHLELQSEIYIELMTQRYTYRLKTKHKCHPKIYGLVSCSKVHLNYRSFISVNKLLEQFQLIFDPSSCKYL